METNPLHSFQYKGQTFTALNEKIWFDKAPGVDIVKGWLKDLDPKIFDPKQFDFGSFRQASGCNEDAMLYIVNSTYVAATSRGIFQFQPRILGWLPMAALEHANNPELVKAISNTPNAPESLVVDNRIAHMQIAAQAIYNESLKQLAEKIKLLPGKKFVTWAKGNWAPDNTPKFWVNGQQNIAILKSVYTKKKRVWIKAAYWKNDRLNYIHQKLQKAEPQVISSILFMLDPVSAVTRITPQDLHIEEESFGASMWQNSETETSAYWLCKAMLERGKGWEDFTMAEIENTYHKKYKGKYVFNKLTGSRYWDSTKNDPTVIENNKDGVITYSFTPAFIVEVYRLAGYRSLDGDGKPKKLETVKCAVIEPAKKGKAVAS